MAIPDLVRAKGGCGPKVHHLRYSRWIKSKAKVTAGGRAAVAAVAVRLSSALEREGDIVTEVAESDVNDVATASRAVVGPEGGDERFDAVLTAGRCVSMEIDCEIECEKIWIVESIANADRDRGAAVRS